MKCKKTFEKVDTSPYHKSDNNPTTKNVQERSLNCTTDEYLFQVFFLIFRWSYKYIYYILPCLVLIFRLVQIATNSFFSKIGKGSSCCACTQKSKAGPIDRGIYVRVCFIIPTSGPESEVSHTQCS